MSKDGTEFMGPMSTPTPSRAIAARTFLLALQTEDGPRLLAFRMGNLLIGRLPDNNLAINHGSVSRRHATVSVTPTGVFVEDLGSQNGCTINGIKLKEKTALKPGDILRIGHVPLFYFGFIQPDNPPQIEMVDTSILVNALVNIG